MRRLICTFVVGIWHKTRFRMTWPLCGTSSELVSSSIPFWQILTAHTQPFRGARDLAFCLKVPLDSLLVWVSSEGSGQTAQMCSLPEPSLLTEAISTKFAWHRITLFCLILLWLVYLEFLNCGDFSRVLMTVHAKLTQTNNSRQISTSVHLLHVKIFLIIVTKWAASWQNQQNGMCAQRGLGSVWASA